MPRRAVELQASCTIALNLFRQLAIYLAPVLPQLAAQTEELFGQPIAHWDEAKAPLVGTPVSRVHAHDETRRDRAGRSHDRKKASRRPP